MSYEQTPADVPIARSPEVRDPNDRWEAAEDRLNLEIREGLVALRDMYREGGSDYDKAADGAQQAIDNIDATQRGESVGTRWEDPLPESTQDVPDSQPAVGQTAAQEGTEPNRAAMDGSWARLPGELDPHSVLEGQVANTESSGEVGEVGGVGEVGEPVEQVNEIDRVLADLENSRAKALEANDLVEAERLTVMIDGLSRFRR